jgi:hypothetical protein
MGGVLPERNHAVKFVAVNDDGTDSHARKPACRFGNESGNGTNI